jgi:hypothetical protein
MMKKNPKHLFAYIADFLTPHSIRARLVDIGNE